MEKDFLFYYHLQIIKTIKNIQALKSLKQVCLNGMSDTLANLEQSKNFIAEFKNLPNEMLVYKSPGIRTTMDVVYHDAFNMYGYIDTLKIIEILKKYNSDFLSTLLNTNSVISYSLRKNQGLKIIVLFIGTGLSVTIIKFVVIPLSRRAYKKLKVPFLNFCTSSKVFIYNSSSSLFNFMHLLWMYLNGYLRNIPSWLKRLFDQYLLIVKVVSEEAIKIAMEQARNAFPLLIGAALATTLILSPINYGLRPALESSHQQGCVYEVSNHLYQSPEKFMNIELASPKPEIFQESSLAYDHFNFNPDKTNLKPLLYDIVLTTIRIHEKNVALSPGPNFAFIKQDSIVDQVLNGGPNFEQSIFLEQNTSVFENNFLYTGLGG